MTVDRSTELHAIKQQFVSLPYDHEVFTPERRESDSLHTRSIHYSF